LSNSIHNDPLSNPQLKTQAEIFKEAHLAALCGDATAHVYQLFRATQLLKKGPLKWKITLAGAIVLTIIELRENYGWRHIDKAQLRQYVIDWQRKKGQSSAANDSQWYRGLKQSEIAALLENPS
jgi:hypothetical protein